MGLMRFTCSRPTLHAVGSTHRFKHLQAKNRTFKFFICTECVQAFLIVTPQIIQNKTIYIAVTLCWIL